MKKTGLLLKIFMVIFVLGLSSTNIIMAQTLKHSYTFEDGTAADIVGGADGTLHDDAVVENGRLILSGTGYVSLPGEEINVASYESLSVEVFFSQAAGVSGNSTLFCFGRTNHDPGWPMGVDYLIYQPTRGGDDNFSRFAISTLNTENPWTTEVGANGDMITDTRTHQVVGVLTETEITLYLDGQFMSTEPLEGNNALSAISNEEVFIGYIVYLNDAKWQGEVYEMNIFDGTLSAEDVEQRFWDFMGESYFDPTLSELSFNRGVLTPEFHPEEQFYDLYVPYGTTSVALNARSSANGAEVVVYDGAGNLLPIDEDITFTEDGIDLEIVVTALDELTELTYYVYINHDPGQESAALSAIEFSAGGLTTEFDPDVTSYIAIAPYGSTSVEVTGIPMWAGASVTGGGSITLSEGTGSTSISVTSEDGESTLTYEIELFVTDFTTEKPLFIQHEASGFVLGESGEEYNVTRIYHAINDEPSILFVFEESGVEGQYFIKNQNDLYLTLVEEPVWDLVMSENKTDDLDSSRFVVNEFEPGRFRIIPVGRINEGGRYIGTNNTNLEGGVYSDKWLDNELAIWSIKPIEQLVSPYDTYLSDLSLDDEIKLHPAFNMHIDEYYVILPTGATSLTFNATPRDESSTVSGDGTHEVSGEGQLTITVTAVNTEYTRDYVVNYMEMPELTMQHSYTFADGTAKDMVGNAHGDINGGTINNGTFISSANGHHITLPAEEIALNEYPAVTLEAYITSDINGGYTMLAYFGGASGSNAYWMQPTRGGDDLSSRTEFGSTMYTHSVATASGPRMVDGAQQHLVSVLTYENIYWYIDGQLQAVTETPDDLLIRGISTENAWLGYGGWNDPSWRGTLHEFNIYKGVMDEQEVALRAQVWPTLTNASNATLSEIMVDSDIIEGFSPFVMEYTVFLAEGTTDIPVVEATPFYENAGVVVNATDNLPGTTTIVVTSADEEYSNTYTIEFVVLQGEIDDASLTEIMIDGVELDGFDSEVLSYSVELPSGTTTVPAVTAVANNPGATMVITDADQIPGFTTIVVTAQDGTTQVTYTIEFTEEPTTNISENEKPKTVVYPTVSNGSFTVNTEAIGSSITVYDLQGRVVLRTIADSSEATFNLSTPGMYIIVVESNSNVETFRVIKNN
ncbi:cadherin-like beta sandwich domain-containing protein [Natronoflexus pectinivorans]|uniref:Putative secreted protein (Por secretion system target) n=1 Tax=Natronoflexus pectinivorans TaxID=682526 RepID=A0A4R2GPX2_9BACT|nr:cadherin-like beta sandwich domain-containing protein [Natronoflexus pectinivorans]TCO09876.1 putative secreted protein (Por secretion system target) [Natronoflexus pectinivorans]